MRKMSDQCVSLFISSTYNPGFTLSLVLGIPQNSLSSLHQFTALRVKAGRQKAEMKEERGTEQGEEGGKERKKRIETIDWNGMGCNAAMRQCSLQAERTS